MSDTMNLTDGTEENLDDLPARWAESADRTTWPRSGRGSRRSRILAAAAVLAIAGLAAVVIAGWLHIRGQDALASARSSALATGSKDAAMIATYTYKDFDSYARQIEAMSTPTFAANFQTDSSPLGKVLAQYQAGSKGSVVGAGLGPVSTGKATVYVFLNETVSNSKQKATTERARMVVTLVRGRGRWLISNAVVE